MGESSGLGTGAARSTARPRQESINLENFREFVGDNDAAAREIIGVFLEDLPGRLNDLRGAMRKGDAVAFMQAAHGLKGSVSTFGAFRAQGLAAQLESMGREHRLDAAEPRFGELLAELDRVRLGLESAVGERIGAKTV